MEFSSRYAQLNQRQKQAVDAIDGPVMVVAGPGTGKTELLSVRIANILQKTDTLPENILCLTFTDSGAAAMRERLIGIIGKDAYKVAIHTFHSFGTEIINRYRDYFYNGADFQPADDVTRYELLRGIFSELPHSSPLATTMNGEFVHLKDAQTVISELKRSGLTDGELGAILDQDEVALDMIERAIGPLFDAPIKKGLAEPLGGAVATLTQAANDAETLYEVTPLIRTIYDSLVAAIEEAASVHPTKPLTAWKKKWLEKGGPHGQQLTSRKHIAKLRATAYAYGEYLRRMEQASRYDYDDMILQVVHGIEVYDDLRFALQEQYLYMMVDEFQDTNLAQMRIIHRLTDSLHGNESANIMVVGDDDQAIYSFQGADISNILRFRELYPAATVVTLTDNYRSQAPILEEARSIITQGGERLETIIPGLDKTLTPHQEGATKAELFELERAQDERQWLIEQIQDRLKKHDANDIVVLTRKHAELAELLPHFEHAGIPVRYERQDNALDEAPIVALELLARVVSLLATQRHADANALMPQLLAHPAWGITPLELWQLSTDAYDSRGRWMDRMPAFERFVPIHAWIVDLAARAHHDTLESLLDRMIGRPSDEEGSFTSPFYTYFFSAEELTAQPGRYLSFLAALSAIRRALRAYKPDVPATLSLFIDFINTHRTMGVAIPLHRTIGDEHEQAVTLMTAHKSKGLEYPIVFIPHAIDAIWGEKARSRQRMIRYPENLPLAPAGDSPDERLRLFYVAMTRAKQELVVSYATQSEQGKATLPASFLAHKQAVVVQPRADSHDTLVEQAEIAWHQPLSTPTADLTSLLLPRMKSYALSATHLHNFLDVTRGGPRNFLLNNLLHFPSEKSASASYGSAIHAALQDVHLHFNQTGSQKPLEDVLSVFETQLHRERMSERDLTFYLQKGSEDLRRFLDHVEGTFSQNQKPELSFKHQAVQLGDARLTGMLDVAHIHQTEKTMSVTDYKTGKPVEPGRTSGEFDALKMHTYKEQLLFYKLMVEHSRDYHRYTVNSGTIAFIEPTKSGDIVSHTMHYDAAELERFTMLIDIVWKKIMALDLPDTSSYEPTLKGVMAFEEDLLNGTI